MKQFELVFIPSPGLSHLVSTVEAAKLLLERDERISITILTMKLPNDTKVESYTQKFSSNIDSVTMSRFRFIALPGLQDTSGFKNFLFDYIENQITHVRQIVSDLIEQPGSRVAGLVLDMFCTKFIEVAVEFGIPSYVFFTSGACSLGLFYHILVLKFEQNKDLSEFENSDAELSVASFNTPVPAKVLPAVFVEEGPMSNLFLSYFKRIREAKGIMVNTFYELEQYTIDSLSDCNGPKVYPVGPIMHLSNNDEKKSVSEDEIMRWLDSQPENSVVFLCFGSMGSFEEQQVAEIASALENCGHRFLWSLRKPGGGGMMHMPTEYENFQEVLPEGFLDRTEGIGKVIGWAPQAAVLSHPAVGGFVSHCGWNSTLESIWCGVPIATFPLYAEQQLNAFYLVKELGMAEAIRIDYKRDLKGKKPSEIVGSGEIKEAIRRLMVDEGESEVRQKVKEMKNKSRAALLEGGSSYNAQSLFIEDVIKNVS